MHNRRQKNLSAAAARQSDFSGWRFQGEQDSQSSTKKSFCPPAFPNYSGRQRKLQAVLVGWVGVVRSLLASTELFKLSRGIVAEPTGGGFGLGSVRSSAWMPKADKGSVAGGWDSSGWEQYDGDEIAGVCGWGLRGALGLGQIAK